MPYVTPDDMLGMYDNEMLVQITNFSDRTATSVNMTLLSNACDVGNRILDGYLIQMGIPTDSFADSFRATLKIHAARLAMDFLAGTDPQIRDQARESMEWLKQTVKLSKDQIEHFLKPDAAEELVSEVSDPLPYVTFEPGYRWEVNL